MEFHKTIRDLFDRRMNELKAEQLPLDKLAGALAASVTAVDQPVPECVTCGACCGIAMVVNIPRDLHDVVANVWEIELEDSPTNVVTARVIGRDRESGNCSLLHGTIGEHVGCTGYETRPPVCREFDAGSDKCHEYRRMYGIEPQLSAEEVERLLPLLEGRARAEKIIYTRIIRDSIAVEYSLVDPEKPRLTTEKLRIEVVVNDANFTEHELHVYEPLKETWFESDFLGLTLDEARELVARQADKGF
jgi:Fe-S-cluster containining protein